MVFSLVRVPGTLGDEFQEVAQFLLTVVDRDRPLLNPRDGLSDQHWVQMVHGSPHGDAFDMLFTEALCLGSEIEDD